MREWFGKYVLSWVLGIANFKLFLPDNGIQELENKLRQLQLQEQAQEIIVLYHNYVFAESLKSFCMVVSVLLMLIANAEQITKIFFWINQNFIIRILKIFKKRKQ